VSRSVTGAPLATACACTASGSEAQCGMISVEPFGSRYTTMVSLIASSDGKGFRMLADNEAAVARRADAERAMPVCVSLFEGIV